MRTAFGRNAVFYRNDFFVGATCRLQINFMKSGNGESMAKYLSIALLVALTCPLWAQASKEGQVTMTELHFNVQSIETSEKFWLTLGGKTDAMGSLDIVTFPGVEIFLKAASTPPLPSAGSIVNHVGFQVPNLMEAMTAWKTAGLKTMPGQKPGQGYVFTPDDLMRVEIAEEPSLKVPIAFHHIHFLVGKSEADADQVTEIKAWYVRMFDARPGKRGSFEAADLPGANLTFSQSPTPVVGTKGRVLDHIGFEVVGLRTLCEKLEAQGVRSSVPCHVLAPGGVAFFTDPWGTYIQLSDARDHSPSISPAGKT
jgi:hypothetical protein